MESKILSDLLKSISLEARIKSTITSHFIDVCGGSMFLPLDEESEEALKIIEANNKGIDMAQPLIEQCLDDIKRWKEDGCPQ